LLIIIVSLILNLASSAKLELDQSVTVLGGFDTNPLYVEDSGGLETIFKMEPDLAAKYSLNEITFGVGAGFDIQKNFKNSGQSKFSWELDSEIELRPDKNTFIELVNEYDRDSDPILQDSESREKWLDHIVTINALYTTESTFYSLEGQFESHSRNYSNATLDNFDNNKRYFSLINRFNFFPETAILLGFKSGYSFYPAGPNASPYGNVDSIHYEGYFGVDGRITNTITMLVKLGFLWLDYESGTNFHEPFFLLEFKDMFSSNYSVTAGYERMAYDSIYSNLYVDQKMYLEFKSIFKDNFINLTTIQYIYRYYRFYPKRIDHRLSFITELALPIITINRIGNNISFVTRFLADWVKSDAYNDFNFYAGPDLAADYKRFVILFGITTKY
jgi:hypothetical protein